MSAQLGLFTPPNSGTETSRQAAIAIAPRAGTLRGKVLEYIRSRSEGATREEIELGLCMGGNTVRPRVKELLAAGFIEARGQRKTQSGLAAEILVAK